MKTDNLQDALNYPQPSKVTTLDLSNQKLKELPTTIGTLSNLRVLNLNKNQLSTLPAEIGKLRNLSTLKLNNNQLVQLPNEITQLSKLLRLELNNNQLADLPTNIDQLAKLRYLELNNNQLATFPTGITQLQELSSLLIAGNSFTEYPQEVYHMRNLNEVTGLHTIKRASPKAIIAQFKKVYDKTSFQAADYEDFLSVFLGKHEQVKQLPTERLFEALTINNDTIRKQALDYIMALPQANFAKKPLTNESTLTFVGDTSFKKNEVREQLKQHNIGYSPKVTSKTSHIVVGYNPKEYSSAIKKKYTYLTQQQLKAFLNELDTPYLLEQEANDVHSVDNLRNLLTSSDAANMSVAIEILKGGGVPEELLTEVFFVAKVAKEKKAREGAKELLDLYAPKGMQKAIKHKEKLGSSSSSLDAEKKVYKKLRKYASLSKLIDWGKIAYYHYKQFGNGLRFLFDYESTGSELRKQVLAEITQGTKLDFFAAYATYLPDYSFAYAYEHYQPKPFPMDILELQHLTDLSLAGCYIEAIPEQITQLPQLKILDCRGNFLDSLPESLSALTALHTIDISDNEFKEFPMVLAQMPQLRQVIFKNNRATWEAYPIDIPAEVKAALPECNFIIT